MFYMSGTKVPECKIDDIKCAQNVGVLLEHHCLCYKGAGGEEKERLDHAIASSM